MPRVGDSSIRKVAGVIAFPLAEERECPADRLELLRDLIHGLPMGIFVVGPDGRILISNLSREPGGILRAEFENVVIGAPFEDLLRRLPFDEDGFDRVREQIGKVIVGATILAHETYQLLTAEPYVLTVRTMHLPYPGNLSLVVLAGAREDERERISRRKRQIRILRAQDEERRRIARDLHDGTSQQLALIQVKLEALRKARSAEAIETACSDIEGALRSAHHQMRTLSYVLHPPELATGGIVEALNSFLRGFARRTNLVVNFENSVERLKLQADLEIALYRVAQEALINVSKHAFATEVNVGLSMDSKRLILEIEDNGIGIPSEIVDGRMPEAVGVGLTGMRERVEALGGTFHVERSVGGTRVSACFPQRRSGDAASASGLDDIVSDSV